jgi:putative ATPase
MKSPPTPLQSPKPAKESASSSKASSSSAQHENKHYSEIQPSTSVKQPVETNGFSLKPGVPLAEQLRPTNLDEYVGQEKVLGKNQMLRKLLEKRQIPSMILWGPPGCGKVRLNILENSAEQ